METYEDFKVKIDEDEMKVPVFPFQTFGNQAGLKIETVMSVSDENME